MHAEQTVAPAPAAYRQLNPNLVAWTATSSTPSRNGGRSAYSVTGVESIPWRRRGFGFGSIG